MDETNLGIDTIFIRSTRRRHRSVSKLTGFDFFGGDPFVLRLNANLDSDSVHYSPKLVYSLRTFGRIRIRNVSGIAIDEFLAGVLRYSIKLCQMKWDV